MRTRTIALFLMLFALVATPALARFVVMDATFDSRTAGTQLGRGGAFQGEPVTGPFDLLDDSIVTESVGDMAVLFPDARILGPSEMYFGLRDNLAPTDGKLTARWTVTPQSADEYRISLRGSDLSTELITLVFDSSNHLAWTDANEAAGNFFVFYVGGAPIEFMLELDVDDGIYTLYFNGSAVVTDEDHGLGAHDVGALVFAHPNDGNATGSLVFDNIQLDWRPGEAPWLLEANFSDKPAGQVIDTRGAFYGEPVSLSGAEPLVEFGPPLGTKALVFEDGSATSTENARFEFFSSVEPHNQPVSISFTLDVDQLEEYLVYVREAGTSASAFLSIKLRTSGQVQFFDAAGGTTAYHFHTYTPGVPSVVEMHFEPILDLYSIWWNGERIIHRRAHGITADEVGSVLFGTLNDADLDGTLYVDRIRAHTLGMPLSVDDDATPTAPAILLGAAPNPFNPATEIRFELPAAAPVTLDIFDARGRLVRRLVDEDLPAGLHRPMWRGVDQRGQRVASGVYHARVTAGGFAATTSMTLVK